ncbi:MAG: hypothetical protein ACYTKD_25425 [Planctomycetota bacterium]|jgi:hypothetical protein
MLYLMAKRIHVSKGVRNAVRRAPGFRLAANRPALAARAPFATLVCSAAAAEAMTAADAVRGSGVRGGLVVHVGCGSGETAAKLRIGDD